MVLIHTLTCMRYVKLYFKCISNAKVVSETYVLDCSIIGMDSNII